MCVDGQRHLTEALRRIVTVDNWRQLKQEQEHLGRHSSNRRQMFADELNLAGGVLSNALGEHLQLGVGRNGQPVRVWTAVLRRTAETGKDTDTTHWTAERQGRERLTGV